MGNSFHFNSTDLSGSTYGVTVTRASWPVISSPLLDVQQVSFGTSITQKAGYSPRTFNVPVIIEGDDQDDLQDKLDSLCSLLTSDVERSIRFDNWQSDRYWLARYTGGLEAVEFMGNDAVSAVLSFIAPDPHAFSTTERTSPDISINAEPKTFNMESSAPVGGNWYAKPVWIVKATNGASSVTFTNSTTGETLTYAASLANGDWLKIDTAYQHVQKSTNSGSTYTDSMTAVSGRFPTLKGGVQNSITISGVTSGGTLTATYRARYI